MLLDIHFPAGKSALLVEAAADYIAVQHAKITAAIGTEVELATCPDVLARAVVDQSVILAGFDDPLFDAPCPC